jgi:hypothetical protein
VHTSAGGVSAHLAGDQRARSETPEAAARLADSIGAGVLSGIPVRVE